MNSQLTGTALCILATNLVFGAAQAGVLQPTSITIATLTGTNDTSNPYTDDVELEALNFGSTSFTDQSNFRAINRFEVLTGRPAINAEWGDNDNNSDGDDNPFTKAGLNPADQESTVPSIQDAGLLQAFNTLSLSEMSDGEGNNAPYSFRVEFSASISDNDPGIDDVPEIIFFERGLNDTFEVKLITGGTFETPTYSDSVIVNTSSFWASGIFVDTTEISSSQEIGIGGFDLNDFGISDGTLVYGFDIYVETTGPDLNGFFLSSTDSNEFGPPLTPVPLPAGLPLLFAAMGSLATLRKRRGNSASNHDI